MKRLCEIVQVAGRRSTRGWPPRPCGPCGPARIRRWPSGSGRSTRSTAPRASRGSPPSSTTAPTRLPGSTTSGSPASCASNRSPAAATPPRTHHDPGAGQPDRARSAGPRLHRRGAQPALRRRHHRLPIADGSNLYLATVIDCHSRRLAGWAVAEHMRTDLIVDALSAARDRGLAGGGDLPLRSRRPSPPSTRRRPSPACAPSGASPSRWARSAPAPTTRWPSR